MKIGILSDTHSYWDDRYAEHFAGCDEIWHAGDIGDYDIVRRLQATAPVVRAVSGNIDHGTVRRLCPERIITDVGGMRLWLGHIGGYPGKYSPGVRAELRDNGITLMVAGHSHILKVMNDPTLGLLHINPGAAGPFGWQAVRTLIRLTIEDCKPSDLEVIELAKPTLKI